MIDNKTSNRALGFLLWFRKYYSGSTNKTYQQIAKDYAQTNYGSVRMYLIELAEQGYVEIVDRAKRTQKFIINESMFKELV